MLLTSNNLCVTRILFKTRRAAHESRKKTGNFEINEAKNSSLSKSPNGDFAPSSALKSILQASELMKDKIIN
jgi:hypothetical protein